MRNFDTDWEKIKAGIILGGPHSSHHICASVPSLIFPSVDLPEEGHYQKPLLL